MQTWLTQVNTKKYDKTLHIQVNNANSNKINEVTYIYE